MAINVLASLKEHLSGDVVSNLASFVGESPTKTDSALIAGIASLVDGLIKQSGDNQLMGNLFTMLTSGEYDSGLLSNIGALSRGGDETKQLTAQGSNLLASLFGDKVDGIANAIAGASGVSSDTSSALLRFIAPLIMSMIGKGLKADNITSTAGLSGFLSGQAGFINDLVPVDVNSALSSTDDDGLADIVINKIDSAMDSLGLDEAKELFSEKAADVSDAFENLGDKIEDMAERTLSSAKEMADDFGDTASKFGSQVAQESKEFSHSAANVMDEAEEQGGKVLPWLLILAALALLWGLLKSCGSQETSEQATEIASTPTTATAPTVVAPSPAVPAAPATPPPEPAPAPTTTPEPAKTEPALAPEPAADTGAYEKKLSTGYSLKAAKDGFVSKLVTFIESQDPISKDLWFTMDGIQFDTNKATIRQESVEQIEHIAEVLKAFPKVKIKIGGYTDNTGKAAANNKLSANRATAVKKAISAKGINMGRVEAQGYGSEHPVVSNDTPEGRQQNRRIDVMVLEK